jgi:hypothetical protein
MIFAYHFIKTGVFVVENEQRNGLRFCIVDSLGHKLSNNEHVNFESAKEEAINLKLECKSSCSSIQSPWVFV